ncbi:MAG: hypothetical protein ABH983_05855, partial [Candidatus Micrarchaeota archaeon]
VMPLLPKYQSLREQSINNLNGFEERLSFSLAAIDKTLKLINGALMRSGMVLMIDPDVKIPVCPSYPIDLSRTNASSLFIQKRILISRRSHLTRMYGRIPQIRDKTKTKLDERATELAESKSKLEASFIPPKYLRIASFAIAGLALLASSATSAVAMLTSASLMLAGFLYNRRRTLEADVTKIELNDFEGEYLLLTKILKSREETFETEIQKCSQGLNPIK